MNEIQLSILIRPDGDHWFACVPELLEQGVSTWGDTREEAARNILEVLQMTMEELPKEGKDLFDSLQAAASLKDAVGS